MKLDELKKINEIEDELEKRIEELKEKANQKYIEFQFLCNKVSEIHKRNDIKERDRLIGEIKDFFKQDGFDVTVSEDRYNIIAHYGNIQVEINDYIKESSPIYNIELILQNHPKKFSQLRMDLSEEITRKLAWKNNNLIKRSRFYPTSSFSEGLNNCDEHELIELIEKIEENITYYEKILSEIENINFIYNYNLYDNDTKCNSFKDFFEDDYNWRQ